MERHILYTICWKPSIEWNPYIRSLIEGFEAIPKLLNRLCIQGPRIFLNPTRIHLSHLKWAKIELKLLASLYEEYFGNDHQLVVR